MCSMAGITEVHASSPTQAPAFEHGISTDTEIRTHRVAEVTATVSEEDGTESLQEGDCLPQLLAA